MIKHLLILLSTIATLQISGVFAGPATSPPPSPLGQTIVEDEMTNILTARAFEASVYGTFAPKLVGNGRYGAGLSLTHPIGDYVFAGIRFDVLGSAYTAGTFGGGLKASFSVYGHKITPYAGTGLKYVIQGDGTQTGQASASVYSGLDVQLYLNKAKNVEVGMKAELEYDSAHAGIQIFHGGPYASIKF